MVWLPNYRHEIEFRPHKQDYIVKVMDGVDVVQVVIFSACNAALSFVERREESYSTP